MLAVGADPIDSPVTDWRHVRDVNFQIDPVTEEAVLSFTRNNTRRRKLPRHGRRREESLSANASSPKLQFCSLPKRSFFTRKSSGEFDVDKNQPQPGRLPSWPEAGSDQEH